MSDPKQKLTAQQVADAGLDDWRLVLGVLRARFATDDFASAARLTQQVGEAAEAANHHPDLDLRWGRLDVAMASHDVGGITSRDLDLARTVSALAAESGARPDTGSLQTVELAIDTSDPGPDRPVLGRRARRRAGWSPVQIGTGDVPTLWFQDTEDHEEPRQRFHLDVGSRPSRCSPGSTRRSPPAAPLASDAEAPSFWVLADPDGNKACLCTWQDRG